MSMRFFFISLLIAYPTFAQKIIRYKASPELTSIESAAYFFVDSTKNLKFEEILHLDSSFQLNTRSFLNFGNTEYPIWIRIDLKNESQEELYLLQELHDVRMLDVYAIDSGKVVRKWFTGAMRPFGTHFLKRNNTVFDLGKYPERIYLRVYNSSIYIPLKVGSIQAISNYFHYYDLLYGGIYGVFFALIIYNILLFLLVRDRLFLYYFLYILSSAYIVFRADNHHHEFIFKQISNFSFDINLSSTITMFCILIFANNYLRIRELTPWLFWILAGIWSIGFLLLPFEWLPYKPWINNIYQLLYIILMLVLFVTSVYIHFLGYKPARFFILAFSFYFVGVIGILLGFAGIISMNNLRSAYIYQICSVLEALFFALAVAYRFNTYRKEARDAKELALRRSQEHEELLLKNNQLLAEKIQIAQSAKAYGDKDINHLLQQMQDGNQLIKKISIPTMEGVIMFPIQDINRLEAMGSYCTIYLTDNKKITTSKPMAHFEQMINDDQFMRIHKSHIVNLNNVAKYIRGEGGWVQTKDKVDIPVSRRQKTELLQRLSIEQSTV